MDSIQFNSVYSALVDSDISGAAAFLYADLITKHNLVVHVTGLQGPTGKSTLCEKLRKAGVTAFEDVIFEDRESVFSNAVYLEISLNKPIKNR